MSDQTKPLPFKSDDCAGFQEQLPELFSSGVVVHDHVHLRTCRNCSSLVRDLEYIAEQAKNLMGPVEPSETVWRNIEMAIQQEPHAAHAPSRTKSR